MENIDTINERLNVLRNTRKNLCDQLMPIEDEIRRLLTQREHLKKNEKTEIFVLDMSCKIE